MNGRLAERFLSLLGVIAITTTFFMDLRWSTSGSGGRALIAFGIAALAGALALDIKQRRADKRESADAGDP